MPSDWKWGPEKCRGHRCPLTFPTQGLPLKHIHGAPFCHTNMIFSSPCTHHFKGPSQKMAPWNQVELPGARSASSFGTSPWSHHWPCLSRPLRWAEARLTSSSDVKVWSKGYSEQQVQETPPFHQQREDHPCEPITKHGCAFPLRKDQSSTEGSSWLPQWIRNCLHAISPCQRV